MTDNQTGRSQTTPEADQLVTCEGCTHSLLRTEAVCTQDGVYLCAICADCEDGPAVLQGSNTAEPTQKPCADRTRNKKGRLSRPQKRRLKELKAEANARALATFKREIASQ